AGLSVLALCFIFLLGLKTELSTLVQVLLNLRDDLWYASDHSQQRLDFISEKALYSRTASDEELRQETLVVENTQRPELSALWAHQPENGIHELLASAHAFSCAKQHWLSAHSREVGLRTKAERLNVLSSIDLSDVAEPDLLSQWNIEAEVEWHLSDLQAQNEF
ncbi:unnamed protein product, partial [Cladocopium goreaui]